MLKALRTTASILLLILSAMLGLYPESDEADREKQMKRITEMDIKYLLDVGKIKPGDEVEPLLERELIFTQMAITA